jgi:LuxR family maltose regulon positive regulatory protein
VTFLHTKLNIPRIYSDLIERPRLTARLNEGTQNKPVLVSSPAGFGKTTLLNSWVAKAVLPVAWLSLDERDNDPVRFWSYFVAALQTIPFGGAKLLKIVSIIETLLLYNSAHIVHTFLTLYLER